MFDNEFRLRPTTPAMREVEKLRQELEKLKDVVYAAKEVLTLEEAAIFMGVSKSSLYKMTHLHSIPFYKPSGKLVYFEKSELLKWLRQNPITSEAQLSEEAHAVMQRLARKD